MTGRLVDGETGRPVSRRTFWVHGFSDDVGRQVSLDPGADDSAFALALPTPDVRLRVYDGERAYELWERRFTAEAGALDVEVRLVPTHWIRLHGKVLWRDGERLRPPSEGDGNVRDVIVYLDGQTLRIADDGAYSIRVPRSPHRVAVVDTNYRASQPGIDLTGAADDEREMDILLAK